MIQLIVKGTTEDARAAANNREIHVDVMRKLNWHQSICEVRDEHEIAVIKWFMETDERNLHPTDGYPIGTCLHYTFRGDIPY